MAAALSPRPLRCKIWRQAALARKLREARRTKRRRTRARRQRRERLVVGRRKRPKNESESSLSC